jgi:ligand-binding sensor domain-containing protein/signal transduction histidine kinase
VLYFPMEGVDLREQERGGALKFETQSSIRRRRYLRAVAVACGIFLVCCSALVGPSLASEPHPANTLTLHLIERRDIQFRRLPPTAKLSQTRVSDIVQDDAGFIWFGTQNGLNRFDGYKCKVFRHDPQRPDSLSGVYIHALFKDRSGFIWVASDQFLDRLNPVTEAFRHYSLVKPNNTGVAITIGHISQDGSGFLWLSTSGGLFRLDPATGGSTQFLHDPNDSATIGDNAVSSTGEDRRGRFWVGTGETLDEFDRATGKVKRHISIPDSGMGVRFHEDRFGDFWIFYGWDGLPAILDPESGKVTRFRFNLDPHPDPTNNRIYAMLEDRKGDMWFGTAANGVLKFDRTHRRFVAYSNRAGDSDSLADNRVTTLFEDREGTIWVGLHQAEPNFFTTRRPLFEKFIHQSGNPNSLDAPLVSALYEDHNGLLWVGSGRGVTRINRSTGQYSTFSLVTDTEVLSIVEQEPDSLWFGTSSGIELYDRRTRRLTEYNHIPPASSPTATEPAAGTCGHSIAEQLLVDHDGTLWGATWEGLCHFDPATQRFMTFKPEADSRGLNYHSIAQDKNGKLWLGSEVGLHQFDPLTNRFTIYSHRSDDAHSLSDNRVNSLYFDHAGMLWVGTQDGLDKFDPQANRFSAYGEQQGMSGNVVSCVLEDGGGALWMSTNKGISRFDPRTASFKNYTVADGLPGDDLTGWGACFRSSTGEMFFGGFSGATAFFPDRIADDTFVPPIVLTDFRLFGNSVPVGKNSPLTKSIDYTDRVTLSHAQNAFSIEFSALSYLNAETNRYRYKLEGLDTKWNEVDSNQRVAAYTALTHGTYTFRVQGATSHGDWNRRGAALRIQILPAWWQKLWFRALNVFATLAILWSLYQRRLKQVTGSIQGRMQERLGERERIARELHDTLLQGIQGLILRFQAIAERLPSDDPTRRMLENTLDRADEVITQGRDRIRHLRHFPEATLSLAEALARTGKELSQDGSIAFVPSVQGDVSPLHPLVRDEAYWIGREALVNAFQHAHATLIELEVTYDQKRLVVRVRDDGQGMDLKVLAVGKPEHWGLRGMRERAKKIGGQMQTWSRLGAGTEVELTVPSAIAYASHTILSRWQRLLHPVRGDAI